MDSPDVQNTAKRRRTEQRTQQSQRTGEKIDTTYYDPKQDPEERRHTKRKIRKLHTDLNDHRQEYLQANSSGLVDTVNKANEYFKNVKQTADAAVDARLLVAAADLSYKKINTLTLGDSSVGIDVDDFVTKCIAFMKRPETGEDDEEQARPASTQTQRNRRRRTQADDDDEDGDGPMNWQYLGRRACNVYNSRPALSGFLLGPLSVEKKVRQVTQRRAREARGEPTQSSRTLQLTEEELDNQEKQNLTVICGQILGVLNDHQDAASRSVTAEYEERHTADMTDEETGELVESLMDKYHIMSNGAVPLFQFCVNPKSFGQTVENLFYVSFLVKEGKAWLGYDARGMPTIGVAEERTLAERQSQQKNQSVFTISFDIWETVSESFGIDKCIIPHRSDQVYDDGVLAEPAPNGDGGEDFDMYN
jgi:non-structural maintenance of chromosomes element 4